MDSICLFGSSLVGSGHMLALLGLIALAALLTEDFACVGAGFLVADGRIECSSTSRSFNATPCRSWLDCLRFSG